MRGIRRDLWRGLLAAGEPFGIAPAGLGARDTLRLEARLSLYGNDIDETTNPYEARLGWAVKLDKGDFLGREALVAIKEAGPSRKLWSAFEMTGRGIARHGYPILDASGETIGEVTSGSPGPDAGQEHRPRLRTGRDGEDWDGARHRDPRQGDRAQKSSRLPFTSVARNRWRTTPTS